MKCVRACWYCTTMIKRSELVRCESLKLLSLDIWRYCERHTRLFLLVRGAWFMAQYLDALIKCHMHHPPTRAPFISKALTARTFCDYSRWLNSEKQQICSTLYPAVKKKDFGARWWRHEPDSRLNTRRKAKNWFFRFLFLSLCLNCKWLWLVCVEFFFRFSFAFLHRTSFFHNLPTFPRSQRR